MCPDSLVILDMSRFHVPLEMLFCNACIHLRLEVSPSLKQDKNVIQRLCSRTIWEISRLSWLRFVGRYGTDLYRDRRDIAYLGIAPAFGAVPSRPMTALVSWASKCS